MPKAVILAGPNGAGKTTFFNGFARESDEVFEFLNADEIARRLPSALSASVRDIGAGRLLLARLDEVVALRRNFVLETTLSSKLCAARIRGWRASGFHVGLIYLRIPSAEVSLRRVALRVSRGGHGVPEADIRRRFERSLLNLEMVYKRIVDEWQVWESSEDGFRCVERSGT